MTMPRLWWDFSYDPIGIVVRSDDPLYPLIKRFHDQTRGTINAANNLIQEIENGYLDYRRTMN